MGDRTIVITLVDRLSAARRRSFVGREPELAAFRDALGSPSGGVVYVHGPGGIGKTSLLRQFSWVAEQEGRPARWRDPADPGTETPWEAGASSPSDAPAVVLIDALDESGAGESWIRDQLVPRLPDGTLLVVASRRPPSAQWRADPGWKGMLRPLRLSNLSAAESRALLGRLALPEVDQELAVSLTHGHPLALALVADVAAQEPGHVSPINRPEVVTALLEQLVDAVPSPEHRAALEASAQVRVTTEPLLAALLDVPDAGELFAWLRDLTIMEYGPRGIAPHDLARDVLAAEVRWRHPDWYTEMHRRAGRYYHRQFAGADEHLQRVLLFDLLYLHRNSPVIASFLRAELDHADAVDDLTVAPARTGDRAALCEMVRMHEGDDAARIAHYWFDRQPDAAAVVRNGSGEVVGFCTALRLEHATDADRSADPGVAAACAHLASVAPLGSDETAVLVRNWMSRDEHQGLSPAQTAITLHLVRLYLTTPRLAFSFLPCVDPGFWAIPCAYADLARIEHADFTVGTVTYGMFGHDWRSVPPIRWLTLLAERETAMSPVLIPPSEDDRAQPSVGAPLDEQEFRKAVRDALRELGRPDRLGRCALLGTRMVGRRAGADASRDAMVAALQAAIRDAVEAMESSPRDVRGLRALHHMFIQPAGTQELAAEVLGLPMSTFRRHLAAGIARLTEILWNGEIAAG